MASNRGDQNVYNCYFDTMIKGGILRVNIMYESTEEREDNQNYQFYNDDGLYHFIDDVPDRENIPILRVSQNIEPENKKN